MKTVEMEVVDIRKANGEGKLKAFADVKIGQSLIAKGFTVVDGSSGLFVSMPRKAGRGGQWSDVLVPVNEQVKKGLQELVMEAYDREVDGAK
jgi:stage V sporulation protein G